jgi:hypothetical protein
MYSRRSLRRFIGAYCVHHQAIALMVEAARTSVTSVYETIQRYIPEISLLKQLIL